MAQYANDPSPTLLKTSEKWNEIFKIHILDPDGWNRNSWHYSFYEERINLDEFKCRVALSTIEFGDKEFEDLFKTDVIIWEGDKPVHADLEPFKLVRRDLSPVSNITEMHGNKIYEIEHIRTRNNSLWMELLKIALEYAPVRTKKVLQQINENDTAVSKLLKELVDE